ncbi:hypothetical protein NKG05_02905 [Oerskovia sp. M15]
MLSLLLGPSSAPCSGACDVLQGRATPSGREPRRAVGRWPLRTDPGRDALDRDARPARRRGPPGAPGLAARGARARVAWARRRRPHGRRDVQRDPRPGSRAARPRATSLLVATGFSICGAAAISAMQGVVGVGTRSPAATPTTPWPPRSPS